jgi:hypothetical protein
MEIGGLTDHDIRHLDFVWFAKSNLLGGIDSHFDTWFEML